MAFAPSMPDEIGLLLETYLLYDDKTKSSLFDNRYVGNPVEEFRKMYLDEIVIKVRDRTIELKNIEEYAKIKSGSVDNFVEDIRKFQNNNRKFRINKLNCKFSKYNKLIKEANIRSVENKNDKIKKYADKVQSERLKEIIKIFNKDNCVVKNNLKCKDVFKISDDNTRLEYKNGYGRNNLYEIPQKNKVSIDLSHLDIQQTYRKISDRIKCR